MPRTKQFDKEAVLDRAVDLFWEKGYHATSMQDLVNGLGINRASMYDTFGNKKALFEQAIHKYKNDNMKKVADFLYYQTDVRTGLYLLFEKAVDEALISPESKGCFMVNTTTELASSEASIKTLICDNKLAFEEVFANYIQYGINQGQIATHKNPKALATFLYTFQNGLQVISKVEHSKENIMSTISTALQVLN